MIGDLGSSRPTLVLSFPSYLPHRLRVIFQQTPLCRLGVGERGVEWDGRAPSPLELLEDCAPPKQPPGPLGAFPLPVPLPSRVAPTGVEDKESWHGKPLPQNMADQVIQEIYSQIQNKKKILATPPQEDAPSVDITNIRMPTPPSYKVGDKVLRWAFFWTGWAEVAVVA